MSDGIVGEILAFMATDKALHDILTVIAGLVAALASMSLLLTRHPPSLENPSRWFAEDRSKRACEAWFLAYGVFWICCFGVIIGTQMYMQFDAMGYMVVCGGLAAPLLLQPVLAPSLTHDQNKPLLERHSFKANLWITVFSFIGNYWYTHYFYNILKASYSMRSWDLNGVPIPMYFATHFYFTFYHTLAALALRKARTTYAPGGGRLLFEVSLVGVMSYVTAFMEALTISGYQCYKFEDRYMAWVLGSAFYGIYFLVSYPVYSRLDERLLAPFSAYQALMESLASGMAVLLLLDFVRVYKGEDMVLTINRPCKLDPSRTCQPFQGIRC